MGRLSPEVRIAQAKLSRRSQIRKSRGGRSIIEAKVQGCSSKGARVHGRRAGRFERQTPMSILTLIVECNCSTSNDLRQIAPKILVGPPGSQDTLKGIHHLPTGRMAIPRSNPYPLTSYQTWSWPRHCLNGPKRLLQKVAEGRMDASD